MEAEFRPEIFRIFSGGFLCFTAGIGRKALEKILKISGRNTSSIKSPELSGTSRFWAGLFDLGIVYKLVKTKQRKQYDEDKT
jgi:hypothetical protein